MTNSHMDIPTIAALGTERIEKTYNRLKPYSKKFSYSLEHTDIDGSQFSAFAPTLEICRQFRDEWLDKKYNGEQQNI